MPNDQQNAGMLRRIVCLSLAAWSALSALNQCAMMLGGDDLWRAAIVFANVGTAVLLVHTVYQRRQLTWTFMLFPTLRRAAHD